MLKEYVKPDMEVLNLRLEERVADCGGEWVSGGSGVLTRVIRSQGRHSAKEGPGNGAIGNPACWQMVYPADVWSSFAASES